MQFWEKVKAVALIESEEDVSDWNIRDWKEFAKEFNGPVEKLYVRHQYNKYKRNGTI